MAFAKVDAGIIHSTIWVQPHDVLRVWIWFLTQCDQAGFVRAAAPAIALACMVDVARCREILTLLESPDSDSRSEAEEGRRIQKFEGGWQIVNYTQYRKRVSEEEKREADRLRIAEKRAEARNTPEGVADCRRVSQGVAEVAQAEAEEDVEAVKQKQQRVQPSAARFDEFWREYPNKKGKADAKRAWSRKGLDAVADDLIGHVRLMAANDDGWRRGFVPMGSTYLNGDRWEDEPQPAPDPHARAGPAAQPLGKQAHGLMTLEAMKSGNRMAAGRTADGATEALLLGPGAHARG